jgi:LysR family transcriptional regulator, regulator for genes of the gallate degradation pathway
LRLPILKSNLRHLRAFEAAADLGSMNRASFQLHISQAAITYALHRVEEDVGATLMNRSPTGSTLTPAGQILKTRVRRLLESIEEGLRELFNETSPKRAGEINRISRALTVAQGAALLAISQQGHIRDAARTLDVGEDWLSKKLRELEFLVEQPLFIRSGKSVYLASPPTEKLARRIGVAFKEYDYARQEIASLDDEHAGTIYLGCLGLARTALLPQALSMFLATNPRDVKISMFHDSFDVLYQRLRRGSLDLLICAERPDLDAREIAGEVLFEDQYSIVCRKGHPLSSNRSIMIDDLLSYEWLLPMEGTPLRTAVERIFVSANNCIRSSIETHSGLTSWAIVRSTDLLMLSSLRDITSSGQDAYLEVLPYRLPIQGRRIFIYTRRGAALPHAHSELIDCLRGVASRLGPAPAN